MYGIQTIGSQVTISSLEMVELINNNKKIDEAVLRHDNFMSKVPIVLGEKAAPKFLGTAFYTVNNAKRERPIYNFPKREACLMAMSYSYELQAKVYDRMTELERGKADSYMISDPIERASRWIEEQKEKQLLNNRNNELTKQIASDKQYTDFGRIINDAPASILVGDFAKLLSKDGFKIGRNRLFSWFIEGGFLFRSGKNIRPYQRYVEQGLFEVKETSITNSRYNQISITTKVTGKGQVYFAEKIQANLQPCLI